MTATKYVDLDGLSRFKTKCDATYRTETQVNDQINSKLATYQNNIVQIVSAKPTVSGASEGILYLVVDTADSSGTVYKAYALENVDVQGTPTPTIVQVGSGTFTPEQKDASPTENSTYAVQSGGVYTALGTKVDNSRITSSVPADSSTDICTSGAVKTALDLKFDIANISTSITDGDTNPVDGNAVYDALALKVNTSTVTSSAPSNGSTDICTSGAVYTALQDYVTSASVASSVTSGDNNAVSADAVYDFFNDNIDVVTNNDIDSLFSSGSSGTGGE